MVFTSFFQRVASQVPPLGGLRLNLRMRPIFSPLPETELEENIFHLYYCEIGLPNGIGFVFNCFPVPSKQITRFD